MKPGGCSLSAAVTNRAGAIVFIDVFVASGGQATDIIAAGFGIEALRKPLGEQRELFGDDVREHLRRCQVAFLFTAAWDDGLAAVRKIAEDADLDAVVYRHLDETQIPFAFRDALGGLDEDIVNAFRERCREIGLSLLQEEGGGASKAQERALGYGNRAMLLATPFNVPTQTLTAIWKTGRVDSVDWHALMSRRKKRMQ
jgi:hypothetical protein